MRATSAPGPQITRLSTPSICTVNAALAIMPALSFNLIPPMTFNIGTGTTDIAISASTSAKNITSMKAATGETRRITTSTRVISPTRHAATRARVQRLARVAWPAVRNRS